MTRFGVSRHWRQLYSAAPTSTKGLADHDEVGEAGGMTAEVPREAARSRFTVPLIGGDVGDGEIPLVPAVRRLESEPPQPPAAQLTVEGVLYALNLRTGGFLVEDDLGHQIDFVVPPQLRPSAVRLAGARVAVSGRGEPHRGGLRLLDVDAVEPAPDPEGVDTLVFRTDADLEQRLASRAPLASLDELAIPGLSELEAAAFLSALGE